MSRLCLYLLGPPRIELDGEPVHVDTRKAVALLAYLALNRERQRRDALVNLLWPESDQSRGRAALRRTLFALRKALAGDWLDADRETVALNAGVGIQHDREADVLNADAGMWVDVDQFHGHLQECPTRGHLTPEVCAACLPPLTAAATLYRGDFLSGFGLRDSSNFDDWQFFQAEGLRREWGEALECLVRCHIAQGDLEAATRYARQWLNLDRLNEAAHCQLMLLYTWSGRRSAALRQYQECVRILESNLGVAPRESTTELYKAIVEGRAPAPPNAMPSPRQVQVSPPDPSGHAPPLSAEGQRRILTVVYADIGRSLAAKNKLTPEEETSLADRLFRLIQDVFLAFGGQVMQAVGTGVLGVLGMTQLHESDSELAIRAALEIQRETRALGLETAVGINTGQVYVRRADAQTSVPAGSVVDYVVRLTNQARTGQILISESTYRLARRAFEFTPLALEIETTGELVAAYRVEHLLAHPGKARGIEGQRADLIGRDRELARLQEVFARVRQGSGQMVSLVGEAGVGKSRLVAELRERALVPDEDGAMPLWLEGRCLELGTPTGYAPFVDILREYLAWRPEQEERRRRESIVYALRRMVERGYLAQERAQEIGPLLGRLLSVRWGADANHADEWDDGLERESAEQIRNRTFAALNDLLLALSAQRPVVLVFEDLHWADTLSLDLISLLMEGLPQRRILLLCVYRPEREHRCSHLATLAAQKCRGCYEELHLRELARQQSQQMVESLLRVEVLSSEIRDLILSQSQGNPFFIEEVVRSLIDAGIVHRTRDGWQIHQESQEVAVPDTVQSVILSRVDRLDEHLKHVLQAASVIGRVFRRQVLVHVMRAEAHLESALWELEERELVYQERAVPEIEYSFKHVLTQEAVYHNLPPSRRRVFHLRVAEAIEILYPDSLEQYSEQLAYHCDEGEDVEKAVAYLFQAGEKARRSHANEEAIAHLGRGLELLRRLPESPERDRRELDLLVTMGIPLVLTRGHAAPKVREAYARARDLSERVSDTRQLFHVLLGLRRYYLHRGEAGTAHQLGEQLLIVAQSTGEPLQLSRAHMMHGETLYWLGEFAAAREHCEQGLALYDPRQRRSHVFLYGNDTGIGCRLTQAQVLWFLGYPDQAKQGADQAIALARELSHPFTLVYALHFTSMLRQLCHEVQVVQEQEETAIRISREHGFALYLAWTTALYGWALAMQGQETAGIDQLETGIATLRADEGTSMSPHLLALLAQAYGRVGQIQEALARIDKAQGLVARRGGHFWEAELHRLQGELLLAQGADAARAEACFRRALDVARRQRARSWELRAATSLARLWQRQGQTKEARALLQEVYGWFSEGLNTADLVKARALLDAL
jgi:predicted ATPase/DNA-binding SARP family transcriptional activator/predicted negative regulator of RcsB-dependent stress response